MSTRSSSRHSRSPAPAGSGRSSPASNATTPSRSTPSRSRPGSASSKLPPGHPAENDYEHRIELARGLGRCDAELAALQKLHRKLRAAKDEIVTGWGEGVLLDVGEGLIRFSRPDGGAEGDYSDCIKRAIVRVSCGSSVEEEERPLDDSALEASVRAFLLLSRLRRRLLNRLSRRLLRLSRSMDGEDVSAPPPPKYGDLRFLIDPVKLEVFTLHEEERKAAKLRVRRRRDAAREEEVREMAERERKEREEREEAERRQREEAAEREAEYEAEMEEAEKKEREGIKDASMNLSDDDGEEDENDGDEDDAGKMDVDDEKQEETKGDEACAIESTENGIGQGASVKREADNEELPAVTSSSLNQPDNIASSSAKAENEQFYNELADAEMVEDLSKAAEFELGHDRLWPRQMPSLPTSAKSVDAKNDESTHEQGAEGGPQEGSPQQNGDVPRPDTAESRPDTAASSGAAGTVDTPPSAGPRPGTAQTALTTSTLDTSASQAYNRLGYLYSLAEDEKVRSRSTKTGEGEEDEPDWSAIKYGAGVGAVHRTMSQREKELEWKRWQGEILGKVPEQPTFGELGLQNRVFNGGSRRKKAKEADMKRKLEEAAAAREAAAERERIQETDPDELVKPAPVQRASTTGGKELRRLAAAVGGGKELRRNAEEDDEDEDSDDERSEDDSEEDGGSGEEDDEDEDEDGSGSEDEETPALKRKIVPTEGDDDDDDDEEEECIHSENVEKATAETKEDDNDDKMDVDEETGKGNATTDAGADDAAKTDNQDKSSSDGSDADDEDEEEKDDDGAEDFKADANAMKGEDDNGEEGDKAKSLEVKKENTCEKKEDDKAAAKDKEAQEKEKNNNDKKSSSPLSSLPKKRKLLSLAPCPSFHDQHRRRLLLLHADLLAHNIADHARKRVAEATEEYNTAFRKSSALQDQRVRVQNELNRMLREHRAQGSNRRNDHAVKVAVARTMHAKRREKWMVSRAERKNRALQAANAGMNDPAGVVARALGCAVDRSVIMEEDHRHPPAGTEGTRGYAAASSRRADAVGVEVGTVLGHAVDAVCVRFDLTHRRPLNRGPWTDDRSGAAARSIGAETFPEFVPPPPDEEDDPVVDPKTGETRSQRHERLESDARRSFAEVSDRLARSEEGRKNAWRKLLKTKAECEGPANHGGNYRRKGAQMAAQNAAAAAAASLPAPPLKHGSRGGGGGSASSRAAAAAAAAGYRRPNPPQHGRMAVPHPIPPPNPAALAHALGHTPSSKSKGGGSRRVHPPSSGGRSSSARSSSASSSAAAVSASAASVANQSDSKYSAERIRARKYSDGSVRPATMPKRDKNGLYMRPAGRRRKGMNWDAVKGVWIPTDNPDPRFGE